MLVGKARVFDVGGMDRVLDVMGGTPGVLFASPGTGGGGISPGPKNVFGGLLEWVEEEVVARCGLLSAGKAGGLSS